MFINSTNSAETFANNIDANTALIIEEIAKFPMNRLHIQGGKEWNLIDVLVHLYLTDKLVVDMLKSPSTSQAKTLEIFGPSALRAILVGYQGPHLLTPDILMPSDPKKSLNFHLNAFIQQRRMLAHNLLKGNLNVDSSIHKHPVLGAMTRVDLIHYLVYHTLRHAKQIRRIAVAPIAGVASYTH